MPASPSRSERLQTRLLTRIHRHFATIQETIDLPTGRAPFTRIADPDAVLDAAVAAEADHRAGRLHRRSITMPYWASLWDSSGAIAAFLAKHPHLVREGTCLDLGCGMGAAGMAMASLGGRVTLVDNEPLALLFARLNTLPWDCAVRRCDWQRDHLGERFHLIVGSDVLYETEQWPFVESFLRRHLHPDGIALIGEPGRPKAEAFPDWIRAQGWSLEHAQRQHGSRRVQLLQLTPARDSHAE